jgi:hypothetical protein
MRHLGIEREGEWAKKRVEGHFAPKRHAGLDPAPASSLKKGRPRLKAGVTGWLSFSVQRTKSDWKTPN